MVLNFVTVMNLYCMFRVAVCSGDAILIEWVYVEVLPLFNVTAKKHYFEIGSIGVEHVAVMNNEGTLCSNCKS